MNSAILTLTWEKIISAFDMFYSVFLRWAAGGLQDKSCLLRSLLLCSSRCEECELCKYAYLVLGIADHEVAVPQPTDRWFGVAEGRAGQCDAAPLLGLYVLRGRIRECWRSWGVREDKVEKQNGTRTRVNYVFMLQKHADVRVFPLFTARKSSLSVEGRPTTTPPSCAIRLRTERTVWENSSVDCLLWIN